jgi:hypothetical protein
MNQPFRADDLPPGWDGWILETVCRQPWLVTLSHDGLPEIRVRGMTKEKALSKAVAKVRASMESCNA